MEGSELVAEALGEHIFEWFLRNKRAEWADYKSQVTPFELAATFPTGRPFTAGQGCPGALRCGGLKCETDLMEPLLVYPDPAPPELAVGARPLRL